MRDIENLVKTAIHDVTGIEEEELSPETHLENDLGVPRQDILKIFATLNDQLDIDVPADLFLSEEYELQTIDTLIRIFKDEQEL